MSDQEKPPTPDDIGETELAWAENHRRGPRVIVRIGTVEHVMHVSFAARMARQLSAAVANSIATPQPQPPATPENDDQSDGPSNRSELTIDQLVSWLRHQAFVCTPVYMTTERPHAGMLRATATRLETLAAEVEGQRQQLERSGLLLGALETERDGATDSLRELMAIREGEMSWRDGQMNITIKHWAMKIFGAAFLDYLIAYGAENYVETRMIAEQDGKVHELILNIRYSLKKSPHTLRKEAETEVGRLQEVLFALSGPPWTNDAPGLRAYVLDLLTSGRVVLDPEQYKELRAHIQSSTRSCART